VTRTISATTWSRTHLATLSRGRRLLLALIALATIAAVVIGISNRADAATTTLTGNNNWGSHTVAAGDTLVFDPNNDTTLTMTGNLVVLGTLEMKPANGNVEHLIQFTGINESSFVGGGMEVVASDVGLWVMGSGRIVLEGESKPAWSYSWQSSWENDEVRAAPNTPGNYSNFPIVTSAPPPNALGYSTELLNLTRNVRVEGTPGGYSHVFIRSMQPSSIKNAAFRYMAPDIGGSDDSTGRYGLHIHMSMNGSRGTIVDGLVIRNTKGHAFVPHGSHGVTFRNTIAYDVEGEAYWWDDPASGVMNETDDVVFDRAVAALVTQASGGNNQRLTGFYLGAGHNPVVINSVAVGIQNEGGANRSGYLWPEDSEGTWVFTDNRAHNNDSNGIFVWQNNELPHVIDRFTAYYNGQAGIEHGAYTNSYVYKNLVLLGNNVAVRSHALGEPGDDSFTDTQIWSKLQTGGGNLLIDEHAREPERPVRFVDCDFGEVVVEDSGGPERSLYDFIRCGLEPSDFDLSGARSDSVFRVQRSDGTAYQLTGNGSVTSIAAFYFGTVPGDFTGEVGLVDPLTGEWRLRNKAGQETYFYYGDPGDFPFMGDWDCNGTDTPGLFRTSDAFAYLRNSNTQGIANVRFFFGNPSDIPIAGDFNGDGCSTVSIYRPSEQRFYIINQLGANNGGLGAAEYSFMFGNPGDKPFVGDFDGDGIDEVGLHRESTGLVYFRNTLTTGIADNQFFFGNPGDRLIAGDWGTVDGTDTPGLFRPSNSTLYFRHSNTQGNADSQFTWGLPHWLPVSGEFGLG
jgi:hypothetical protein